MTSKTLTNMLLKDIDSIVPLIGHFKDGRQAYDDLAKQERWTLNPSREDHHCGSFSINLETGLWNDFATGDHGDIIKLYQTVKNISYQEACERYLTVPTERKHKRIHHQKSVRNSPPDHTYTYRNPTGKYAFDILRWDSALGKEIRPSYKNSRGQTEWKFPPEYKSSRPLYRGERLASYPGKNVMVVEGEKACEAAELLFPEYIVVTWSGGANAVKKSAWSVLANRRVLLWPDNDEPGIHAMATIESLISDIAIQVLTLDVSDRPNKWDAADLFENCSLSKEEPYRILNDLIRNTLKRALAESPDTKSKSQRLLFLLNRNLDIELWSDISGDGYITLKTEQKKGSYKIDSKEGKLYLDWLFHQYFPHEVLKDTDKSDVIQTLKSRALYDGNTYTTSMRLEGDLEKIYIDIGDETWQAIEVSKLGWKLVDGLSLPFRFIRPAGLAPYPIPQRGGNLSLLRSSINIKDDKSWSLLAAWILGAFHPKGPYPGLVVHGQQGSAKSTLSEFVRDVVDPNTAGLRRLPNKEENILLAARNSRVLAFDNLSGISNSISDILCTISTGGAFSTRKLYSDTEEILFYVCRPWILNGIDNITSRADLLDRMIIITLDRISPQDRRTKAEVKREFETNKPLIFGAVLDMISSAMRNYPKMKVEETTRMADFNRWVLAAEDHFGVPRGTFTLAYQNLREDIEEDLIGEDNFIQFIEILLNTNNTWKGSATQLFEQMEHYRKAKNFLSKEWPKSNAEVSKRLRRAAPLLERRNIFFESGKENRKRVLRLWKEET